MLFPGIVTVVEGVIVRLPLVFVPDQNVPPRTTLCKVSVLFPDPPFAAFHVTWTVATVTGVCGFVIVIYIVEP